jgi:hypothetical protein
MTKKTAATAPRTAVATTRDTILSLTMTTERVTFDIWDFEINSQGKVN